MHSIGRTLLELTPISGPAIYVVQMREYGWPWGCVHADLKPEFDPDWVFTPAYHAGDVFWLPLCANVAVPTVVCVVLLSAMNWWSGRSHNMVFTQGPLSVGDSSGHERGPLR